MESTASERGGFPDSGTPDAPIRPKTPIRRLTATSLVEQATKEIRRAIVTGALRPGQEFSQREIAEQLGVSFIPVREALHHLESQGLIALRSGRSAAVAPLSAADLHDIYRLRKTLEPQIAGRACVLLRAEDFGRLDEMSRVFADENLHIDDIFDVHHQFHVALLAPAATAWDFRLLEGLWRAAERYIRLAFGALDESSAEHHRRHQAHGELLDAFRTRCPEVAEQAWTAHLNANEVLAKSVLPLFPDAAAS